MRILAVHWAFAPVIGGVETHLAALLPALARRAAWVGLLTGAVAGRPAREVWEGVHVRRTALLDLEAWRATPAQAARDGLAAGLARLLDEARPDVLHAHNLHYFSPAHLDAVAGWCRLHAVPLVLTAHNVWDDPLWRRFSARADVWSGVIAVSAFIRDALVRSGYPRERIEVVHHGLDTERFQPTSARLRRAARLAHPVLAGRRVLFHAARIGFAKGSLVCLEAVDRLRRELPDVLLVSAGAGSIVDWQSVQHGEIGVIREEVRRRGLERHVHIQSFTWQEMARIYPAARVVVYPSLFEEPFGLAPLEAMSCAVPVVVTRSGGMPEFVPDGRAGFIVPRGDAAALADRCLFLLRDPRAALAMGRTGRQAVLARHTLRRMVEDTCRVYSSVLAGGRTGVASAL